MAASARGRGFVVRTFYRLNVTHGEDGGRAAEARRLRVEEQLSGRQIQERLGVSKIVLQEWLRGIPPPEWTRRPTAKDGLRAAAIELRLRNWSVNDIAVELGVARSTAWLWVKHLPLDRDSERAREKMAKAKQLTDGRWQAHRAARDARRASIQAVAAAEVGGLSDRELLLLGAAIYWCEGSKVKPWRPHDVTVTFINSDPVLVSMFIRFLESVGVSRGSPSYRVSIHESADATAATMWWRDRLDLPISRFLRPSLKRHNPRTNRRNTGDDYHGCLVVKVPKSRELYWRIEGMMSAIGRLLDDEGRGGSSDVGLG